MSETATNLGGTCGVCFRPHAIVRRASDEALVLALHGYTRPAEYIQTKGCFSERREPWELSKVPALEYRTMLVGYLSSRKEHLKALLSGKIKTLTVSRPRPVKDGERSCFSGVGGRCAADGKGRPIFDDVQIGPSDPDWNSRFASVVNSIETTIEMLVIDIASRDVRLAAWAPSQLVDTTEQPKWIRKDGAAPFQVCFGISRSIYGNRQGHQTYDIWNGFGWERITEAQWRVLSTAGNAVEWNKDRALLLTPDGKPAPASVRLSMTQAKLLREIRRAGGTVRRDDIKCADRSIKGMVEIGVMSVDGPNVSITEIGRVSL